MAIKQDTLDQLLSGRDPREVFSRDGLFDELKKAPAERVLDAERDDHLESETAAGKTNHRNGYSKKTVPTETSKIDGLSVAVDGAIQIGPATSDLHVIPNPIDRNLWRPFRSKATPSLCEG